MHTWCLLTFILLYFLPSHLFPVFEGRLATPGILPEQLNRGHITRFLTLRPPISILVRYRLIFLMREEFRPPLSPRGKSRVLPMRHGLVYARLSTV